MRVFIVPRNLLLMETAGFLSGSSDMIHLFLLFPCLHTPATSSSSPSLLLSFSPLPIFPGAVSSIHRLRHSPFLPSSRALVERAPASLPSFFFNASSYPNVHHTYRTFCTSKYLNARSLNRDMASSSAFQLGDTSQRCCTTPWTPL